MWCCVLCYQVLKLTDKYEYKIFSQQSLRASHSLIFHYIMTIVVHVLLGQFLHFTFRKYPSPWGICYCPKYIFKEEVHPNFLTWAQNVENRKAFYNDLVFLCKSSFIELYGNIFFWQKMRNGVRNYPASGIQ